MLTAIYDHTGEAIAHAGQWGSVIVAEVNQELQELDNHEQKKMVVQLSITPSSCSWRRMACEPARSSLSPWRTSSGEAIKSESFNPRPRHPSNFR
jgi:hypothetical protein